MTRKPPAARLPKPVTPQKVRAVLRKAEFIKAVWKPANREERRRGNWGWWSYGYHVSTVEDAIRIKMMSNQLVTYDLEAYRPELARIALALAAAGIACEVRGGAVWVAVEQGQPEDDQ